MPEVRREAGKAAAALAALLIALLSLRAAAAATLPPEVYTLAGVVALYAMNGDVKDASSYSVLLCRALAAVPPGALAGKEDEAYRLAYLASIRSYAPGYVDYQLMQLVYQHLVGGARLDPTACGSAAPPASQPANQALEQLARSAATGESYDSAYRSASSLVSQGAQNMVGSLAQKLFEGGGRAPPPPPPANTSAPPAQNLNLREILEAVKKLKIGLRGLNITPPQAPQGISPEVLEKLGGGGRAIELTNLKGLEAGTPALPQLPRVQLPGAPSLTLPPMSIPSIDPRLAVAVGGVLAAAVLLWQSRGVLRRIRLASLRARVRRAEERGDIDALIEAFAALLEEIGEECRPKEPGETHREYARVLRGDALREYLRAALAYEAAKFGGKLDKREAARIVREAAERLAKHLECSS